MNNIQIENSYRVWKSNDMKYLIQIESMNKYHITNAVKVLARSYKSMYVEWWFHNIGYYLTKPLSWISYFKIINQRFKHVDLDEWD